jgi:hypothetical protein
VVAIYVKHPPFQNPGWLGIERLGSSGAGQNGRRPPANSITAAYDSKNELAQNPELCADRGFVAPITAGFGYFQRCNFPII